MSKKFWTILGLLVVLTLTVAACSPAATPTEEEVVAPTEVMEEPTEAPPEPTEVMEAPTEEPEPTEEEMVEPELSLVIWADETRAPILQALAEDFQATYGVGLDVQQVTGINDQLPIAAPAGEGPDIFIGPHDRLGL